MTFWHLTSLVELPVSQLGSVLNRSCYSGQCISAEEKVKNNVGAPALVVIAFRSSRTLFQLEPAMFPTYLDTLDINRLACCWQPFHTVHGW